MKPGLFAHSSLAALASLVTLAGLAPTLGGCGSLGDVDHREPLAILQGQLTQASASASSTPSNVRVAVVWMNIEGDGYKVTQDVRAEAVFPSSFRLELTDPPPAAAMWKAPAQKPDVGPAPIPNPDGPAPAPDTEGSRVATMSDVATSTLAIAYGAVVAYEDRNGNGKLDLVDDGASSYIDRILGSNSDLALLYIEGTPPADAKDKNGRLPNPGYNIYRGIGRACEDVAVGSDTLATRSEGSSTTPCALPEWLPMTTAYNLPLTADPKFAKIMCRSSDNSSSGSGGVAPVATPGPGPSGKYPSPTDPSLHCDADGKTYSYSACTKYSEGLCKGDVLTCESSRWSMPTATAPAGWPCTIP